MSFLLGGLGVLGIGYIGNKIYDKAIVPVVDATHSAIDTVKSIPDSIKRKYNDRKAKKQRNKTNKILKIIKQNQEHRKNGRSDLVVKVNSNSITDSTDDEDDENEE